MYGKQPRPKVTAKPAAGISKIIASEETIEELKGRRRPRKQDFVAALIAIAIVVSIIVSAVVPFFM